jgi:hypothetical protein
MDETTVQLVGSTKDLIIKKSSDRLPSGAVLLGFPDYNAIPPVDSTSAVQPSDQELPAPDTTQRFLVGDQVTALPGTREEVNLIEKTLLQQHIPSIKLLGPNASEENIKALKDPGVLHIATHGFFIPDLPSADAGIKNNTVTNNSNPLLRSGLLFAYCQSALSKNKPIATVEDGILTAYEAMNLNLDQTQLLVLSACDRQQATIEQTAAVADPPVEQSRYPVHDVRQNRQPWVDVPADLIHGLQFLGHTVGVTAIGCGHRNDVGDVSTYRAGR